MAIIKLAIAIEEPTEAIGMKPSANPANMFLSLGLRSLSIAAITIARMIAEVTYSGML
jgi:hypothetical protein